MQRCWPAASLVASSRRVSSKIDPIGLKYVRGVHDIVITRTGKPLFRQSGGRSSLGGHTITVFGATGFLGRYIVSRMANAGCMVIIPYREEMAKRHLEVTGDLGRVHFLTDLTKEFDLRNTQSIEESVRHSDVVINLIGRDYTTKNFNFKDVHVEGTQRIVEAVAKYDCDRYIHVSSFNANPRSASEFYRTKGIGEREARRIFPETTIVRPSMMFGFEDRFLHRLAGAKRMLTSNNMNEKLHPVHVIDVGKALQAMIYDDSTAGQTYELFGPKEYSMQEIAELVDKETLRPRTHVNLPKPVYKLLCQALDFLWWPTYASDQVEREFIDQKIDASAKTFADLGIKPDDVKDKVFEYVRHYRSNRYYDLPPMTEKEKREDRKYLHVQDDIYG